MVTLEARVEEGILVRRLPLDQDFLEQLELEATDHRLDKEQDTLDQQEPVMEHRTVVKDPVYTLGQLEVVTLE